ncbi:unnamed protein product [Lampetra fluviatilis]
MREHKFGGKIEPSWHRWGGGGEEKPSALAAWVSFFSASPFSLSSFSSPFSSSSESMFSFWRRWLSRWWRKAAKKILLALCKRLWRRAWETEDDGGGGPDQHVIAWREQPLFQTRSVLRSPMDPSMLDRSLYTVVVSEA